LNYSERTTTVLRQFRKLQITFLVHPRFHSFHTVDTCTSIDGCIRKRVWNESSKETLADISETEVPYFLAKKSYSTKEVICGSEILAKYSILPNFPNWR